MRRREFLNKAIPAVAGPLFLGGRAAAQQTTSAAFNSAAFNSDQGWVELFNGRDLTGWYTFLRSKGKNNDPKKVFKVEEGMIHINDIPVTTEDEDFGYLATEKEYSNCGIRVEFKWGTKRFPPRALAKRDSGLLYFIVGPDQVWPTCIENQIQETDTGDLWILGGAVASPGRGGRGGRGGAGRAGATPGGVPGATPGGVPGGRGAPQSSGRFIKDGDFESLTEWNIVEVILDEDRSTQLVNGRIVNTSHELKQPDREHAGQLISLTRGKIALQAEGSEVWYRSVKMKPINL
jgi:hypothetical protein